MSIVSLRMRPCGFRYHETPKKKKRSTIEFKLSCSATVLSTSYTSPGYASMGMTHLQQIRTMDQRMLNIAVKHAGRLLNLQ
jgi:hypothetical protein